VPIFVTRLPAIVEYLGEGYPMYLTSLRHLERILADEQAPMRCVHALLG
jgi:hypothetical protein